MPWARLPAATTMPPYEWVNAHDGNVPGRAIPGGHAGGVTLYIGRAPHNGGVIPGKVVPTHNCFYFPWRHEEHKRTGYQVSGFRNGITLLSKWLVWKLVLYHVPLSPSFSNRTRGSRSSGSSCPQKCVSNKILQPLVA